MNAKKPTYEELKAKIKELEDKLNHSDHSKTEKALKESVQESAVKDGEFRILCLGESTTAPWYVDNRDISYPAQLQKLLNSENSNIKYRVYNRGEVDSNTGIILSKLEDFLDETRPHLVIIMAGSNDWNLVLPYENIFI